MNRRQRKLLSIILAILVGLLPLQGVVAQPSSEAHSQIGNAHAPDHRTVHAGDRDKVAHSHHCGQCKMADNCGQLNCTVHHCAACAVLIPSSPDIGVCRVAVRQMPRIENVLLSSLPFALFRPPRA